MPPLLAKNEGTSPFLWQIPCASIRHRVSSYSSFVVPDMVAIACLSEWNVCNMQIQFCLRYFASEYIWTPPNVSFYNMIWHQNNIGIHKVIFSTDVKCENFVDCLVDSIVILPDPKLFFSQKSVSFCPHYEMSPFKFV